MNQISIDDDSSYYWGGAMMCAGFWALCFVGSLQALKKVRIQMNIGSSASERTPRRRRRRSEAVTIPKSASKALLAAEDVHIDQKNIEFVPMSIAWRSRVHGEHRAGGRRGHQAAAPIRDVVRAPGAPPRAHGRVRRGQDHPSRRHRRAQDRWRSQGYH